MFVGPNSILQGSKLEDNSYVAMGATIRHATVHSGGFVAAGAVVFDGVEVKEGEIWAILDIGSMRGSKGFSCICVLMDQQFYTFSVIAFYLAMKISQVISLKNIFIWLLTFLLHIR